MPIFQTSTLRAFARFGRTAALAMLLVAPSRQAATAQAVIAQAVIAQDIIAQDVIAQDVIAQDVIAQDVIAQDVTAETAGAFAIDTALVLAVDTSQSVNEERFRLQMDGIAAALEDKAVINTILGGPRGAISLMLLAWSDTTTIALPWTPIRSVGDAMAAAARIRALPRTGGEYTCMARMLRHLHETVLEAVPGTPLKVVVDVSGDGIDNCETTESLEAARSDVLTTGAVINGLPVVVDEDGLVGEGAYRAPGAGLVLLTPPDQRERLTLAGWYERHVIGGFGAFSIPANGYGDFARAMRSKFVVEIGFFEPANRTARIEMATGIR